MTELCERVGDSLGLRHCELTSPCRHPGVVSRHPPTVQAQMSVKPVAPPASTLVVSDKRGHGPLGRGRTTHATPRRSAAHQGLAELFIRHSRRAANVEPCGASSLFNSGNRVLRTNSGVPGRRRCSSASGPRSRPPLPAAPRSADSLCCLIRKISELRHRSVRATSESDCDARGTGA